MVIQARKILISIVVALFFVSCLHADSVDDLLSEVNRAVLDESYTRAIALLEEGKKANPYDVRLPMSAGKLYRERELYHLALAEFRSAEKLDPAMPEMLHEIASVLGYLGRNDAAVEVLEQLLLLEDPDFYNSAIDDLSWMYFKTYRMNDGISLLEEALENDFNRNWAHTLGTLYSGLYDLEKSRYWYNRSITDALDSGDEFFASVAHYNLSLLELTFYLYDESRQQAMRSIDLRSRAGGHMIIGELDFLAWQLGDALKAYRRAESLDETPLARVDMASFYQRIGYLDEAIRFIDEVMNESDDSWMYHYGVDRTRFGMDLHRILAASWLGKVRVESMTPQSGILGRLASLVKRLVWRGKSLYHQRLYRSLSTGYSRELRAEGNILDAEWNSAVAAEGYRSIALRHLEEAMILESALTPRSGPWYALEMGLEAGDNELLIDAMNGFSPEEGDPYERTLRGLANSELPVLPELYKMNPGGMRQYGLSLPVLLNVTGDGAGAISRKIRKMLRNSGYKVVRRDSDAITSALLTIISEEGGKIRWFMSDTEGSTRSKTVSDYSSKKSDLAAVLSSILDSFYTTRLAEADE